MTTTLSDLEKESRFSGVTIVTAGRDCLIMYDTIASALRAPWYGDDSSPRNTFCQTRDPQKNDVPLVLDSLEYHVFDRVLHFQYNQSTINLSELRQLCLCQLDVLRISALE